jgi:hypothetical protein
MPVFRKSDAKTEIESQRRDSDIAPLALGRSADLTI